MIKTTLITLAMLAFTALTVNAQEPELLEFNLELYEGASYEHNQALSKATGKNITIHLFEDDISFCVPASSYNFNWGVFGKSTQPHLKHVVLGWIASSKR